MQDLKKKRNLDIESWTIQRYFVKIEEPWSNIAKANVKLMVQTLNLHIHLTNIKNLAQ